MSLIEQIGQELQVINVALAKALRDVAVADNNLQEIAAKAVRSGFVGIAQHLTRVQPAVREAQTRIAAVQVSAGEAGQALTAVPTQVSPQLMVTVLVPVGEKLTVVNDGVAAALAKVDEAQRLAATALQGGQPGPLLALLNGIKQTLGQVSQRAQTARQHLAVALTEARQTGSTGK